MSSTLPKQQHKKLCQLSPNSGSGYHRLFIVDCLLCHFDCLLKQAACKLCFGPRLPCPLSLSTWVGRMRSFHENSKKEDFTFSSSGNIRIAGRKLVFCSPVLSKVLALIVRRRRIELPAIPPRTLAPPQQHLLCFSPSHKKTFSSENLKKLHFI